jgi:hypothetical protein
VLRFARRKEGVAALSADFLCGISTNSEQDCKKLGYKVIYAPK